MTPSRIPEVRLTNSMTGKREPFRTREPGKLTMYSCGPTVYNLIHIGNLRAALVSDLFFRYFRKIGFEVTFVRNYTDVDDKIIDRAKKDGVDPDVVTKRYIAEVEKDYALAGMLEPTKKTLVSEHIREIIEMIQAILARGHAYVAPDGEVLFSVESFPGYGKLSGRTLEELAEQAGARVEVSKKKKSPLDFTLWKPAKPGEPKWPSPWGEGRPGWHIECSAMACKHLGPRIDLHHGGEDLVFPHHENEIAQSEGASGEAPYVGTWVHNAFLRIRKEKMSKSLGNIVSARDFLSRFGGEVTRFVLLTAHYRTLLDYDDDSIDHALDGLTRLYEAKKAALAASQIRLAMPDLRAEGAWGEFVAHCEKARGEIAEHFANDLGVPGALASLFSLVREWNKIVAVPRAMGTPSCALGGQEFVKVVEQDFGDVTGIGQRAPEAMLAEIARIRAERAKERAEGSGGTALAPERIEALLQERIDARKSKNFARADEIRKELDAAGVAIQDGPQGTTWSYR